MFSPLFRNPPMSIRVLGGLLICFAIFSPLRAEAAGAAGALPTHVQLRPIMAPITGARQNSAPITVFIQAVSKENLRKVCFYRPRIVDAILRVLSSNPIPVVRRKLDLSNVPALVLAPINKALGGKIVWAVYVVPGAVSMGYNNGLFNFTAASCKIIEENKAQRKKATATKENS